MNELFLNTTSKNLVESNENLVMDAVCVFMDATSVKQTEYDSFIILEGEEANNAYKREYRIFNSYEEAEDAARVDVENFLEVEGLTENLVNIAMEQNLVNLDWFREAFEDIYYCWAFEEGIEYIKEDFDEDVDDEGEVRENYYNSLIASIEGDGDEANFYHEFCYQFGEEYVLERIKEYDLVDLEALAAYIVECDGAENTLSTYDGEYFEVNGLYFFRID